MATAQYKVGSDIIYYCSRCGLNLAHCIMAMMNGQPVRVRCNTCKSERNYKAKKTTSTILRERSSTPRVSKPSFTSEELYQNRMKAAASKAPKTYRVDVLFVEGDVVEHPKFGRGVVTKTTFPDRIDILFEDGLKTLMGKCEDKAPV